MFRGTPGAWTVHLPIAIFAASALHLVLVQIWASGWSIWISGILLTLTWLSLGQGLLRWLIYRRVRRRLERELAMCRARVEHQKAMARAPSPAPGVSRTDPAAPGSDGG